MIRQKNKNFNIYSWTEITSYFFILRGNNNRRSFMSMVCCQSFLLKEKIASSYQSIMCSLAPILHQILMLYIIIACQGQYNPLLYLSIKYIYEFELVFHLQPPTPHFLLLSVNMFDVEGFSLYLWFTILKDHCSQMCSMTPSLHIYNQRRNAGNHYHDSFLWLSYPYVWKPYY